MILQASESAATAKWSAQFDDISQQLAHPSGTALLPRGQAVLFVRGLFGAWIPQHLAAPLSLLRAHGLDAHVARTSPKGTLAANAARLGAILDGWVARGERVWLLTHSKGGVEVLLALAADPNRWQALSGWASVQMPKHGAPLLDSLFDPAEASARRGAERWREPVECLLIRAVGAGAACRELTRARLPRVVQDASAIALAARTGVPWLAIATQANTFTSTLEMRHRHFERRFAGEPHDGVFLTRDQRWPEADAELLLSGIDHSQPSVGGLGFDHARFWLALLAMLPRLPILRS